MLDYRVRNIHPLCYFQELLLVKFDTMFKAELANMKPSVT
jgi:hypothetical protein